MRRLRQVPKSWATAPIVTMRYDVIFEDRDPDAEPSEIVLADTIGAVNPDAVPDLVAAVTATTGLPVRGHFHNTHGRTVDNAPAAIAAGATASDCSLSGLGGCPLAPDIADRGHIASDCFAAVLAQRGIRGLDPEELSTAALWLRSRLLFAAPSRDAVAGHA